MSGLTSPATATLGAVLAGLSTAFTVPSFCFTCSRGRASFIKTCHRCGCLSQVRVVSAAGDMPGGSRIVDLHNGLYEAFYTAPAAGTFLVHVQYADAGVNPVHVDIRGSPFTVECTDPWIKYRVLGALPARRQVGFTLLQMHRRFNCHLQLRAALALV